MCGGGSPWTGGAATGEHRDLVAGGQWRGRRELEHGVQARLVDRLDQDVAADVEVLTTTNNPTTSTDCFTRATQNVRVRARY